MCAAVTIFFSSNLRTHSRLAYTKIEKEEKIKRNSLESPSRLILMSMSRKRSIQGLTAKGRLRRRVKEEVQALGWSCKGLRSHRVPFSTCWSLYRRLQQDHQISIHLGKSSLSSVMDYPTNSFTLPRSDWTLLTHLLHLLLSPPFSFFLFWHHHVTYVWPICFNKSMRLF